MVKRMRRQLAMAGVALLAVFGMAFVAVPSASAASGTISGNIQCFYGNNQVVGVWVDAENGTDGFASLTSDGMGGKNYSYTLSQTSKYTLHVGCSGTSSSWGSSMTSPKVTATTTIGCAPTVTPCGTTAPCRKYCLSQLKTRACLPK